MESLYRLKLHSKLIRAVLKLGTTVQGCSEYYRKQLFIQNQGFNPFDQPKIQDFTQIRTRKFSNILNGNGDIFTSFSKDLPYFHKRPMVSRN